MLFAREENPGYEYSSDNVRVTRATHQLSGCKMALAEWTKHGSAYIGEFKILREYSLDEAMTINLFKIRQKNKWTPSNHHQHIKDTDGTKSTRIPLLHVTLHGVLHRVGELADNRYRPFIARQMSLLVSVDGLLQHE